MWSILTSIAIAQSTLTLQIPSEGIVVRADEIPLAQAPVAPAVGSTVSVEVEIPAGTTRLDVAPVGAPDNVAAVPVDTCAAEVVSKPNETVLSHVVRDLGLPSFADGLVSKPEVEVKSVVPCP